MKLALPATRHIAASDTFFAQTRRYHTIYLLVGQEDTGLGGEKGGNYCGQPKCAHCKMRTFLVIGKAETICWRLILVPTQDKKLSCNRQRTRKLIPFSRKLVSIQKFDRSTGLFRPNRSHTLSSHFHYTFITLSSHFHHTFITLSSHFYHTFITLSSHHVKKCDESVINKFLPT
jgi:hypothetical protein